MNYLIIYTICVLSLTKAQDDPLPKQINRLKQVHEAAMEFLSNPESVKDLVLTRNMESKLRNLESIVKNPRSTKYTQYLNYGCWCNFGIMKMGHGTPLDYSDKACKQLWENYHCIDEEAHNAGDIYCNSANDDYEDFMVYTYVGMATGMKAARLDDMARDALNNAYDLCDQLNPGSICKTGACKAEIRWTFEITLEGLFEKSSPPPNANVINYYTDRFYSNEYVNYDKEMCRISGSNGNVNLECCGVAPSHIRYSSSRKGCCGKVLYDLIMSKCEDDSVVDISFSGL